MISASDTAPRLNTWSDRHQWFKLVTFRGLPSSENLDRLLAQMEDLVVQRKEDRRIFRAVIECVQNLQRHAAPDLPARFVLSGRTVEGEPQFSIRSLNPIREEDLGQVSARMAHYANLQQMAADSIANGEVDWRELYRKWLGMSHRTPRGGAGLGWVALARLAAEPPLIRLIESEDGPNLFFSVEVRSMS